MVEQNHRCDQGRCSNSHDNYSAVPALNSVERIGSDEWGMWISIYNTSVSVVDLLALGRWWSMVDDR